ncbi:hypothetical protein HYS03_00830 [Candidatus Woesebacteria bacterium]|nr:hypothetical protein [Candidatus Woesebacteria bacterium]QQG47206.1 MAG: hypothetical protein HY044_03640 [Candidatus Woesebacteria bacterium]
MSKPIKILIFFIIFALLLLFLFAVLPHQSSLLAPTPTPSASTKPNTELMSIDSPDGKFSLTLKKHKNQNTITYSFFVKDVEKNEEILIFTKELVSPDSISIPFNSFSPNNKYLFLKEQANTQTNYYVMSTNLTPFKNGEKYLSVSDFFTKKYDKLTLEDITGWADPNLLVLNTNTLEGKPSYSLWFEISSNSFIQLATRFN